MKERRAFLRQSAGRTWEMVRLELRYGKPISQVLLAAIRQHDSLEEAAQSLGISGMTLRRWLRLLGLYPPVRAKGVPKNLDGDSTKGGEDHAG
jgi:hypothetical protein